VRILNNSNESGSGPYCSANKSEHPNRVLSWNRDSWNAAFRPLPSVVEEHCVDDHLILKDAMSHLDMCWWMSNGPKGVKCAYNFVSPFLCPRADIGGIENPIKKWDLPIIK
jgi:hypothetical protein